MSFFNIKRRILAFKYAAQGIKWAFKTQPNLWIHLISALCALVLAILFKITTLEWIIITSCIVAVFAIEFINTAIEWLVDSIYKEKHPLAGKIKDVAAASVLIVAIGSAVIGAIIFYPYLHVKFL